MSELDSIDIDTPEDWQYAEYIMNMTNKAEVETSHTKSGIQKTKQP